MNCVLTKYQLAAINPGNWLFEEYSKTSLEDINLLVDTLTDFFLKKIKINQLYELTAKCRIGFELVPEDTNVYNRFDPNLGITIIPIKSSQIEALIKDPDFKKRYLKYLKYSIVHEDTHKQQFGRYEGYSKNYKYPNYTGNPFELLSPEDVAYFSQTIEADSYGRQVGEALKHLYPEKPISWIFKNVDNPETEDLLNVFRSSKISKKAFQHFWRALYDYVEGNEKDLQEPIQLF